MIATPATSPNHLFNIIQISQDEAPSSSLFQQNPDTLDTTTTSQRHHDSDTFDMATASKLRQNADTLDLATTPHLHQDSLSLTTLGIARASQRRQGSDTLDMATTSQLNQDSLASNTLDIATTRLSPERQRPISPDSYGAATVTKRQPPRPLNGYSTC